MIDSTNAMIKGVKDTLQSMDADSKAHAAKSKNKVCVHVCDVWWYVCMCMNAMIEGAKDTW